MKLPKNATIATIILPRYSSFPVAININNKTKLPIKKLIPKALQNVNIQTTLLSPKNNYIFILLINFSIVNRFFTLFKI